MSRALDAARQPLRTVPPGTSLRDVAALMAGEGLRVVVVVDDGAPAGIVTERDLVVRGLARGLPGDSPVDGVMTARVVTAEATAPAGTVYRLLRDHGIRQVPLLEGGGLAGIVERDDLADEATAELLAGLHRCPRCGGDWLRPVVTAESTNFLCLRCRACWHPSGRAFAAVEPRSCPGCPEHNFCRLPLIDYGLDTARSPATS